MKKRFFPPKKHMLKTRSSDLNMYKRVTSMEIFKSNGKVAIFSLYSYWLIG